MQDPDLENARFEILDFSRPSPKLPRTLKIIDARDIPRLNESRKTEMLESFAEGYFKAKAELAGRHSAENKEDRQNDTAERDSGQLSLFD